MAGTEVGSLYYDLGIDDKALNSGLDDADKNVKGFGGTLSKFGDNVQAGFRDVAKVLAVTGAALTLYAKNATDFTVDFVKSSKSLGVQIGVTTTEASRLVAAFGRMGIEASDASAMFGIFSKQIVASTADSKDNVLAVQKLQIQIDATKKSISDTTAEMQKNGDKSGDLSIKLRALQNTLQTQQNELGKTADSFAKLGISTTDASGQQKDFNTILFEVADKFKDMPNGVDKTTIALDLFGRSGKDMIKVLNLGSDGIKDLETQADKLGLTLNAKTIGAVNGLVQSQKDLKEQTDAMKIAVGTATAPVLTRFNEKLNDITKSLLNAPEPIKGITTNVLAFGGAFASGGSAVAGFLGNISSITPKIAGMVAKMGEAGLVIAAVAAVIIVLQLKFHILNEAVDDSKIAFQDLKNTFSVIMSGFQGAYNPLTQTSGLFRAIYQIAQLLASYWQVVLLPALQAVWAAIAQNLWPALQQLWDAFVRLYNALQPALTELLKMLAIIIGVTLLVALWALVAALNIVIQVFSMVVSAISNVINWMANLIAWVGNVGGVIMNVIINIGYWFTQLPRYAADAANGVTNWFRNLPSMILNAVGNLGSLLYNAGKDLINGMINGITDKFKDLAGKVKDAVGNAVSSVKGFLGIHSPSKVFHEIGTNVTQGFVNGINANAGLAIKAMSGFADAVISPTMNLAPAAVAGGANTHNYGGTTVNIGTVEDRQDADYIIDRLDTNTRRQQRGVSPV